MKADVIREASEFAAKQGKVAIPLASNEQPLVVGRGFASFEYPITTPFANAPQVFTATFPPSQFAIFSPEIFGMSHESGSS
jgi:hypothetical protein